MQFVDDTFIFNCFHHVYYCNVQTSLKQICLFYIHRVNLSIVNNKHVQCVFIAFIYLNFFEKNTV